MIKKLSTAVLLFAALNNTYAQEASAQKAESPEGYITYKDVMMNAQSSGSSTIFFENTGTTGSNCDISASEAIMAFLFYGSSTAPTFYSPTNTTNVAKNYKCNGKSWVIGNPSALRATRFRVLVPGTSRVNNIYSLYNANAIKSLDDAFFKGIAVPGGNTAKYSSSEAATTGIFNTSDAYLIYVHIPDANGGTGHKNALICVKEVTYSAGKSTIKFDIMVQK